MKNVRFKISGTDQLNCEFKFEPDIGSLRVSSFGKPFY